MILTVLLAGCGRFAFDPASPDDADVSCASPVGHDEDGDSFDDGCDVCPQLADDQRDGDGDGVGDACDPFPTQQQRTLFDPFTGARAEWTYDSGLVFVGDSLSIPAVGSNLGIVLLGTPDRMVLEAGGRIGSGGTDTRQFAMHIGSASTPANYYCELYDSGIENALQLTYTLDQVNYVNLDVALIGGGLLENGSFRMVFEHTPPDLGCVAWWNGVRYEVRGTDPGGISAERTFVRAYRVDAELDYFVRLLTP